MNEAVDFFTGNAIAAGLKINGPLTANPGFSATGATPLKPYAYNVITTVAGSLDSFVLPAAKAGTILWTLPKAGISTYAVWALGTDKILSAGADPVDSTNNNPQIPLFFVCLEDGNWISNGGLD